jgi:hypothetical protein
MVALDQQLSLTCEFLRGDVLEARVALVAEVAKVQNGGVVRNFLTPLRHHDLFVRKQAVIVRLALRWPRTVAERHDVVVAEVGV